jgi:hypothetical protein
MRQPAEANGPAARDLLPNAQGRVVTSFLQVGAGLVRGTSIGVLRRRLARAGASIAMAEHDLLAEPGIGSPGRGGAGRPAIG